MQLNDRDTPLHIYGPEGLSNLVKKMLSLGYFKPKYEILTHEINANVNLVFDEYIIKIIDVNHGIPAIGYSLIEKLRPGKFNKAKALSLGIPEGPLFSQLQKGKTILLKNNKKISPEMVLGPSRKGRKIVISGDTRPIRAMVDFAKDADVLIHEATFDSKLAELSSDYGHSTAYEAGEIARKANVDKLFLVHISPRYLNKQDIEDDAKRAFKKSYVPRDYQEIEVKLRK
jgi:ribonuclease Z